MFTSISFLAFLIPALIAYFATPYVIKLAKKINIIDDPKKNKHEKVIHTYPTPRGGGLASYLAILVCSLIFLPLDNHLIAILLGASLIVFVGILDDKYNLSPYLRIVLQLAAASLPIISGIGIAFLTNPFNGILDLSHPRIAFQFLGEVRNIWVLSDLFAILWIVFLMNVLNMGAKGVDGQLPGIAVIASLVVAILSLKYSADITQWPVFILALITAGSFFGFLPWSAFPQKIMPSYSGSTLAGYMLAVLSILSTTKVGTLVVALGLPLVDTGYTVVRRLIQGKSPVWGDRGHLHHRLLDAGLSKKQVTYFYWFVTAILGALALNLNARYKFYTIVGVIVFVGGLILWLTRRSKLSK